MKKIMALAFALFFAATAAAETHEASEKIMLAMKLSRLRFYMKILALPKMLFQNIHRRTFWKILDCRKGGWALDVKLRER